MLSLSSFHLRQAGAAVANAAGFAGEFRGGGIFFSFQKINAIRNPNQRKKPPKADGRRSGPGIGR